MRMSVCNMTIARVYVMPSFQKNAKLQKVAEMLHKFDVLAVLCVVANIFIYTSRPCSFCIAHSKVRKPNYALCKLWNAISYFYLFIWTDVVITKF